MVETGVLLFCTAFFCLPSLISHKKEAGRNLLRMIVFVQGGIGAVLFLVALITSVSAIVTGIASGFGEQGIVYWLTIIASRLVVVFAGFIMSFGLIERLILLKASPETRERTEKLFYKLIEFQTAIGFFCLVMGVWIILYDSVIYPVVKI